MRIVDSHAKSVDNAYMQIFVRLLNMDCAIFGKTPRQVLSTKCASLIFCTSHSKLPIGIYTTPVLRPPATIHYCVHCGSGRQQRLHRRDVAALGCVMQRCAASPEGGGRRRVALRSAAVWGREGGEMLTNPAAMRSHATWENKTNDS